MSFLDLPQDILNKINLYMEDIDIKDIYITKWKGKAFRKSTFYYYKMKKLYEEEDEDEESEDNYDDEDEEEY
jgi:hypothetical protein